MKKGLWAARLSTAEIRNCLASDFSRKPRAPASRTSRTKAVRVVHGEDQDLDAGHPGPDLPGRLDPVHHRQRVVEDHDVRAGWPGPGRRPPCRPRPRRPPPSPRVPPGSPARRTGPRRGRQRSGCGSSRDFLRSTRCLRLVSPSPKPGYTFGQSGSPARNPETAGGRP